VTARAPEPPSGPGPGGGARGFAKLACQTVAVVVLTASVAVLAAAVVVVSTPFPREVLASHPDVGPRILDRHGALLHHMPGPAGARAIPLDPAAPLPRLVTAAVLAAEDRRFHDHAGLDGLAILRALWAHLRGAPQAGGASTLTQQLVKRALMPDAPRTLATKLEEAAWALRLELALPKEDILRHYLDRAPFANGLVGVGAAARGYFGRPPEALSPAEAALLAALPNAPSRLDPRRSPEAARARAHLILRRMHADGTLDDGALALALTEPLQLQPSPVHLPAAHLVTSVIPELNAAAASGALPATMPATLPTTLDAHLQRLAETIVANPQHPQPRGLPRATSGDHQAAIVILDTASGEVRAWVGSRGWTDADALGRTDAVVALRQPGSALKPFIHGLLLERGATPDTLLDDSPGAFETGRGVYRPENYDRRHRGPVSLREALGSSLNLPAVRAVAQLGVDVVLTRLRALGLRTLDAPADHYGLGLALGNGEVRLVDLAQAYATLGRLGLHRETRWRLDAPEAAATRVMPVTVAKTLLEVLADDRARGIGFGHASALLMPFRVAAKTGTSSDHRDNLAFGVTPAYTVGVWVGHFDGRPVDTRSPHLAAAPILRAVFLALYPRAARPSDVPWFQDR
jgi:penicillin-binding protein 1C